MQNTLSLYHSTLTPFPFAIVIAAKASVSSLATTSSRVLPKLSPTFQHFKPTSLLAAILKTLFAVFLSVNRPRLDRVGVMLEEEGEKKATRVGSVRSRRISSASSPPPSEVSILTSSDEFSLIHATIASVA